MPRLVHLNGPPGIGKSTLAARLADRHPGTLALDVDALHRFVGGWQDPVSDTWAAVWPLAKAMAVAHLDGGRDVVLPQYFADAEEIAGFEALARGRGADFREVVLLDDRHAAIERFQRRAAGSDDPWVRHQHQLVQERGGDAELAAMHDALVAVTLRRPDAVVVPSRAGAVEETYALLVAVL